MPRPDQRESGPDELHDLALPHRGRLEASIQRTAIGSSGRSGWIPTISDILAKMGDNIASAGRNANAPPVDPRGFIRHDADPGHRSLPDEISPGGSSDPRLYPDCGQPKTEAGRSNGAHPLRRRPRTGGAAARLQRPSGGESCAESAATLHQHDHCPQIARKFQEVASGYIHGDVVDATGIKGSYDFTLSFSSAGGSGGGGAAPPGGYATDPNGSLTLFDAVSRQLGLKLAKEKRPIPVLVIDSINEKPYRELTVRNEASVAAVGALD